jgi:hypothetical protein
MKIHELAALCSQKAKAEQEGEEVDPEYPEDDNVEEEQNLTEALLQLENAWALLDALTDHFSVPKARMNKYLKREIARVATQTFSLLQQYDMAEIHGPDEDACTL